MLLCYITAFVENIYKKSINMKSLLSWKEKQPENALNVPFAMKQIILAAETRMKDYICTLDPRMIG